MHDDRTLVEGRPERAQHHFIRPARYGAGPLDGAAVPELPVAVPGAATSCWTTGC
ncbi:MULTISPECIES: hypothetical protein [unclassified Streptomyces]|uniref:hypothetical protein n=1 Tax=unclassified Streptomyces TaxID=2593676 RepID=UPI0036934C35